MFTEWYSSIPLVVIFKYFSYFYIQINRVKYKIIYNAGYKYKRSCYNLYIYIDICFLLESLDQKYQELWNIEFEPIDNLYQFIS